MEGQGIVDEAIQLLEDCDPEAAADLKDLLADGKVKIVELSDNTLDSGEHDNDTIAVDTETDVPPDAPDAEPEAKSAGQVAIILAHETDHVERAREADTDIDPETDLDKPGGNQKDPHGIANAKQFHAEMQDADIAFFCKISLCLVAAEMEPLPCSLLVGLISGSQRRHSDCGGVRKYLPDPAPDHWVDLRAYEPPTYYDPTAPPPECPCKDDAE